MHQYQSQHFLKSCAQSLRDLVLGLDQHAQGLQLQMLDGKEKLGKRVHTKNKKYVLLGALQALTKDQGYYSYDEYSEHVGIRVPSE